MEISTVLKINRKVGNGAMNIVAFLLLGLVSSFDCAASDSAEDSRSVNGLNFSVSGEDDRIDNLIFSEDPCSSLPSKEIYASDFGFPNGVMDGSLSATNVDMSSKWGLPSG
ncbi:MAG: hypothetical protein HKN31_10055, partial [Pricia sp.]|nr:hypothetical protein [Pricia sp.]